MRLSNLTAPQRKALKMAAIPSLMLLGAAAVVAAFIGWFSYTRHQPAWVQIMPFILLALVLLATSSIGIYRQELIRERTAAVLQPIDLVDRSLEATLAYEQALSMIETNCAARSFDGDEFTYYDTTEVDAMVVDVFDEVGYLESRGLIQRHPLHPFLVVVLEESEATA